MIFKILKITAIVNTYILLTFVTPGIFGAEFGEGCTRLDDDCDPNKFLQCNVPGPAGYTCGCNNDTALENMDVIGTCEPYRTSVGESCAGSFDGDICSKIEGGECNGTVCACAADFLESSGTCLAYTQTLYGTCTMPQQCERIPEAGGATCALPPGVCICKSETHLYDEVGTKCLEYRFNIGEVCERAAQCARIGEGVNCNNNACGCDGINGYFLHPDGTRCLKYADALDAVCEAGTDVCARIEGAECNTTTLRCQCNSNHVTFVNGTTSSCLPYAGALDQECTLNTTPDHCAKIPGAMCDSIQTICQCDNEHFLLVNSCQRLPTVPLDICLEQGHCLGVANTICRNNRCFCDTDNGWELAPDASTCVPIGANSVNMTCAAQADCTSIENTLCLNNMCQCQPNFVEKSDTTGCIAIVQKLQAVCIESAQCRGGIGEFSICQGGRCVCENQYVGHVVDGGKDRCLAPALYNGACEVKAQCDTALGPDSDCIGGRCACSTNAGYLNGTCYRQVWLNNPCFLDEECIVGSNINARCYSNVCQCIQGTFETNGRCYGRPLINDACVDTAECRTSINGTVECVSGLCRCRSLAAESFDMTTCGGITFLKVNGSILVVLSILVNFMILKL